MPTSLSKTDPEVTERSRARRNGWHCPWHPLQILAWFFIGFFTIAYYGFMAHYVPGLWSIITYVAGGVLMLALVMVMIATTSIDPAEPAVRSKLSKKGHHLRPQLDRNVHKRVIEDLHCNLCQVDVSSNAKHCRVCDKCVSDFDHHCMWLNTCIGSRNYRWFFATISLTLISSLAMLLYNIGLFVVYFTGRDMLRWDCFNPTNITSCDETLRVLGAAVPDPVFPTVVAILGLLSAIAVLLVGHLTCFHIYLLSKGLSTFDYIILQREKPPRERRWCLCLRRRKPNRITPTDEEASIGGSPPPLSSLKNRKGSNSSTGSAGMATFGRTPPPSDSSGENGAHDNLTDEQKLAKSNKKKAEHVAIEMDSITSQHQDSNASEKETLIEMNGGSPKLPKHMMSSPSSLTEQSPPEKKKPTPPYDYSDDDCGPLAFMSADHEEECDIVKAENSDDLNCSLLPAMVVSNSLEDKPIAVEQKTESKETVKLDEDDEKPKKELVDRATSPTIPSHLLPVPMPTPVTTTCEEASQSSVDVVTTVNGCAIPKVNSEENKEKEHLAVELGESDISKEPRSSLTGSPLKELPVSSVSQYISDIEIVPGISSKTSGSVSKAAPVTQNQPKRVTFQDEQFLNEVDTSIELLDEAAPATDEIDTSSGDMDNRKAEPVSQDLPKHVTFQTNEIVTPKCLGPAQTGPGLTGRPLPPIGGYPVPGLSSARPLPPSPLSQVFTSADNISSQSNSSLHLRSGSASSLPPLNDPRYSNAARRLPKLVIKSKPKESQLSKSINSVESLPPRPTSPIIGYREKTTAFSRGMIPVYDDDEDIPEDLRPLSQ